MASSSILPLLLLVIFVIGEFIVSANADAKIIEQTCEQVKQKSLCLYVLESDEQSLKANVPGLSLIASMHTFENATFIGIDLGKRLQNASHSKDNKLVTAIKGCQAANDNVYNGINKAIAYSQSKHFLEAVKELSTIVQEPTKCLNVFKQSNVKMPMELQEKIEIQSNAVSLCLDLAELVVGRNNF